MCVLAAAVASVAGCVGMPSNGPSQELSASPQSSVPDGNLIGPFPSGPQPGADPTHIVEGFLIASASYPTYTVAQQYLVAGAVKMWHPGSAVTVFSKLVPVPTPVPKASPGATQRAEVTVTGSVQARFDGVGQYISAQNQDQSASPYSFKLVKVDGQWRITNPPSYRMLPEDDFPLFYKAQDLYFFDDPQNRVLVPDSVFVPLGATVSQLLDNLVKALAAGPGTSWLVGATDTQLPAGIKVQDVAVNGSAVTVSLAGQVSAAGQKQLGRFAAQLVWTLTGKPVSSPAIQSVVVNLNGQPWSPATAPCPGGPAPDQVQTQAAYECFNPYPSAPSGFYYVDHGQIWARCGSESLGLQGNIGSVMPIVGRTGVLSSQGCAADNSVHEGYTGPLPVQPQSLPAATLEAVSPDGKYLAIVSAANGDLYVGPLSGPATSFLAKPRLTGGGITALSWDRNDNLWAAWSGNIVMLPAAGKTVVTVGFAGSVTDLTVAPDGVRIAFVAQPNGSTKTGLFLAAIGGGQQQNNGQLGSPTSHESIRAYASLGGPGLTDLDSITWYDADDLIALNGSTLWDVPIDGQPASALQVAPKGATSITAAGTSNVLVAGLSGGLLEVSTSLEGPWFQLGEPGQNPAYPG